MTHHTEAELMPCPFCGSEHVIMEQYKADGLRIICKNCAVKREQRTMRKSLDWLKAGMISDWNIRAPAAPVPLRRLTLDEVEQAVGYHSSAWDCVDPSDLVDAIFNLAAAPQPPDAFQTEGGFPVSNAETVAIAALEKVLRAVQRHLPPERIGERETIAEIISIVDPWPLGKPPEPWKDHMTAELVGKLTDVARQFHGTQQLRERIAGLVRPLCERIKQLGDDRMPEGDMGNPISASAPAQLPEPPFWYCESKTPDEIWPIGRTTKKRESAFKDGYFNQQALYTEQQVRQLLAAHGIKGYGN